MMDVKKVQADANKELLEEREKKATGKIKAKMREIESAKLVVRNLERELQDIVDEVGAQ